MLESELNKIGMLLQLGNLNEQTQKYIIIRTNNDLAVIAVTVTKEVKANHDMEVDVVTGLLSRKQSKILRLKAIWIIKHGSRVKALLLKESTIAKS